MSKQQPTPTIDLHALERAVESYFRAGEGFYEAGTALARIRDQRAYKDLHSRFDDYIWEHRERWGVAPRTVYQLIKAAAVVDLLRNCADVLPTSEAQARELTGKRLTADDVRAVWAIVVETAPAGKITAGHIKRVVAEYLGDVRQEGHVAKPAEDVPEEKDVVVERLQAVLGGIADLQKVLPSVGDMWAGKPKPGDRESFLTWWREILDRLHQAIRDGDDPMNRCAVDTDNLSLTFATGYRHTNDDADDHPHVRLGFSARFGDPWGARSLADYSRAFAGARYAPYEPLGVRPDASDDEIQCAYRELLTQYDPSQLPADVAPELRELAQLRRQQVEEAYRVFPEWRRLRDERIAERQRRAEEAAAVVEVESTPRRTRARRGKQTASTSDLRRCSYCDQPRVVSVLGGDRYCQAHYDEMEARRSAALEGVTP